MHALAPLASCSPIPGHSDIQTLRNFIEILQIFIQYTRLQRLECSKAEWVNKLNKNGWKTVTIFPWFVIWVFRSDCVSPGVWRPQLVAAAFDLQSVHYISLQALIAVINKLNVIIYLCICVYTMANDWISDGGQDKCRRFGEHRLIVGENVNI